MASRRTKRKLANAFSATDEATGPPQAHRLGNKRRNKAAALPSAKARRKPPLATSKQTKRGVEEGTTESDAVALPSTIARRKTQLTARKQTERDVEEDDSDESDADDMYEVETILKEQDGRFYVKWAGYDSGENTWEPECNLKAEMIGRFRQQRSTEGQRQSQVADSSSSDSEEEAVAELTANQESETMNAEGVSESSITGSHVSFSPIEEEWMPAADYARVGSAYLTGVIAREYVEKGKRKKKKGSDDTVLFSNKILEGIANYNRLNGNELRAETWEVLCRPYHEEASGGDLWDEFEAVSEDCARYDCRERILEDAGEGERVSAMGLQPRGVMNPPEDLFEHGGGSTAPHVKPEFEGIFKHSASSTPLPAQVRDSV